MFDVLLLTSSRLQNLTTRSTPLWSRDAVGRCGDVTKWNVQKRALHSVEGVEGED